MPEEQTGGQAPAGNATQPGQAPQANTEGKESQSTMSAADYERMIADLRKENASHRTKLKSFEEAQAAAEAAKLSDLEKAQKALADLQTKHAELEKSAKDRSTKAEIRAAAAQHGIKPELATRLIDTGAIEFGDDGEPKNIGKLLEQLVKDYPELKGQTTPGATPKPASTGAPMNPPRSAGNADPITWDYIAELGKRPDGAALYEARKAEIQAFMAKNRPR
jgi:hypothetical protein